jgi:Tfp pilus assembly protein PilF
MGEYALALVDSNQAIRLKPDYASAYLGRAFAEQQLGQGDKAAADFAKAEKLDPKLASVIPEE